MKNESREQRLQTILHAYLQAIDRGEMPDRQQILDANPDLRDELADYFADASKLDQMAKSLKTAPYGQNSPGAEATGFSMKIRYFGDYELLEKIAQGGMGVVYKARQVSLNRIVALKMILKGDLASEADVLRFRQEAEAAANLDHPNIVPIYEVGEHEGLQYFSMKLIETGVRSQGKGVSKVKQRDSACLVAKVARAVHHAHQRGVLHRDLKPSNILIDENGEPHVTDFGLAKRIEGEGGPTHSGVIVGTPSYMAPEQARAEKGLSTAVDVWSLGAVLYELLTGRPPFRGDDPLSPMLKVVEKEPAKPRSLDGQIDRDLETICLKCLHKEPHRRYGSAADLADDLERWLKSEPIRARPVTGAERLGKWARRQPVLAGALVSVAAAVLGLLVLAGILWQNAELRAQAVQNLEDAHSQLAEVDEALKRAENERTDAEKLADKVRAEVGQLQRAAVSAQHDLTSTQRAVRRTRYAADLKLALATWQTARIDRMLGILERHRPGADQEEVRGFEWHYLWRLAHADRLTVGTSAEHFHGVRFSPDGKLLALSSSDPPALKFLDVATGKVGKSIKLPSAQARQIAFTPDSKSLVMLRYKTPPPKNTDKVVSPPVKDFVLSRWDVKSCEQLSIKAVPISAQQMVLSPDLKKVVGLEHAKDGTDVMVWNIEEQEPKRHRFGRSLRWSPTGPIVAPDNRTLAVVGVADDFVYRVVGGMGMVPYSVFLWDLVTGKEKAVLNGHAGIIWCVAFSPDGKTLASAGLDRVIRLWDPATGKERATLSGHTSWVMRLAFTPDGKTLASTGRDGTIRLWNLADGKEVHSFKGHRFEAGDLDFSPDGKTLASAAGDVKLWDVARSPAVALKQPIMYQPFMVTFSPDLKDIVSAYEWLDAATGKVKHPAPSDWWTSPTFSPDQQTLAFPHYLPKQGYAVEVFLLDPVTGKQRGRLAGMLSDIKVVFSADSRSIAGWRADRQLAIWDAASGKERLVLQAKADTVNSLAFGRDGKTLITGTGGGLVHIWDAATGAERSRFPTAFKNGIGAMYLSPDGRRLACIGSPPQMVKVVDLTTGKGLLSLEAPSHVRGAAFSPDGTRLATWGGEMQKSGMITFWDAATGDELLTLDQDVIVIQAAFSRDGHSFGWVNGDGRVTIWDATPSPVNPEANKPAVDPGS
jgi:WD40 repeat protein/tRNA A-37 threonylcarbamoyl transferase component Bud32